MPRTAVWMGVVGALAPTAGAFSPSLMLPRAKAPAVAAQLLRGPACAARAPARHGSRGATIRMAGAGGKAVTLDSDGFDMGDADPIGSIDALNKVSTLAPTGHACCVRCENHHCGVGCTQKRCCAQER